jgi:glycosyltransferase involved in cell wall biosynthesis
LLKAWAQFSSHHPEAHLLLVGPRHDLAYSKHDEFRQTIQSLAQASVKPENVHFLGGVTNVEDYLRTSDIFVFTSHREGMPNVIPEAMGVGLPVVTTPFIGLPEEFGQAGNHYLLVERDPKLLSTTLDRLLDQPDLLHGVGMAGQEWIRNTMDVEHSIDSYVNLYRSLK